MTCEYIVTRAAANLPQSTTETLFTVSGGDVLLTGIYGKVTTAIQAQADDTLLYVGADQNLIPFNTDLSGLAAGTLLGAHANGSAQTDADSVSPFPAAPVVLRSGAVIQLQCLASNTGQVAWTLWYRPLSPGAQVAAA